MPTSATGFRNILVATDVFNFSVAAFKQAIWLARQTGVEVALANTIPDLSMSVYWGPREREANQRELHERSEAAMRRMIGDLDAMDLDVKFATIVGGPFVGITHALQDNGLICYGDHPGRRFDESQCIRRRI